MCKINPLELIEKYSTTLPVPVYGIMRELGLGVNFEPLENNISGWIERLDGDKYSVTVNSSHAIVRQRFTAAHELGHFIYHRELFGRGVGDTRAYRAEGSSRPNSAIYPVHERQANSFAANLLMPFKGISLLLSQDISDPAVMADHFEVSVQAMHIRLGLPYQPA
jgi:hypothetical protein